MKFKWTYNLFPMIKSTFIILISLFIFSSTGTAQIDSVSNKREYSFIIRDSPPALFTMRQTNVNYLSLYRLYSNTINEYIENDIINNLVQIISTAFLFMPITHEEGHRSILTANNIGAISKPFFNSKGAAYVTGVSNSTLIDMRDNYLPEYIRLHTTGLESDYMLTHRVETMLAFNQEVYKNLQWEYIFRKLAIIQYMASGLFKYNPDLEEESNELERDIVGHDIYGAARHLYRPTMEFYRYTKYSDLGNDEIKYIKRVGFRSFLNLLNPAVLGKTGFQLNPNLKLLAGLGYSLSPFGDYTDENIWIKIEKCNLNIYFRQFQNHTKWFPGFGVGLTDFPIHKKVIGSVNTHFWSQPENFDFFTSSSFTGGSIDATLQYLFFSNNMANRIKAISFDIGTSYKTKGFLPEETLLGEHFGFRVGASVWVN